MKKVDILLATYNGEKYLKEQIDSILNQSFDDFRLIISDDCSTDNTKNILEEYKKKDSRIELYFSNENKGIAQNFEFLLSKVKSDYFMFSDQDDIWKKEKIEKSIYKLEKSNLDLAFSDLEVVNENLQVICKSYWKLKGFYKKIKKYNNFESLYLNNYITGCTIICKSKWIEKIMPIPKTSKFILHDYWLSLIVSQTGTIGFIDEPLIKYRQHKNNRVGSKKQSDYIEKFEDIRNLFIKVKIEHFTVFVNNSDKFINENTRELNKKCLNYFESLRKVKFINFKNWGLFFKIYKYEKFSYLMENFLILNIPIIAKPLVKIIKKVQ